MAKKRKATKVHWGGGLTAITKKNKLRKNLSGFPLCMSGYRAELIVRRGDLTSDKEKVTCGNCRKLLDVYLRDEDDVKGESQAANS